jgi:DNA replication and repair protein RecF
MFVDSIQLNFYKNYSRQNLRFTQGVNIFVGENGQGKTNLLEAIYSLTRGDGFRPGDVQQMINKNHPDMKASIQGVVDNRNLKSMVRLEYFENKKSVFLNQKKTNSAFISKNFPSILFSPESLVSIKEGPEQRRVLLDEWLTTYSLQNYKVLQDFKRVLLQRNRLLRSLKNGEVSEAMGFQHLAALNLVFLEKATLLTEARLLALESVVPLLQDSMAKITGDDLQNVEISVDYVMSGTSVLRHNRQDIYNALSIRMKELSAREVDTGHSLVGPQKHDIQFLYNGEDSRFFCSQGQQRALILSFKMAQIVYHYTVYHNYPILLLDDVLSELDHQKRTNLVEFLKKIQSQIFITTTEIAFPHNFEDQTMAIYRVSNGYVEKSI